MSRKAGPQDIHRLNNEKQAGLPANKHTQILLLFSRQMFATTLRPTHNHGKRFSPYHGAADLNFRMRKNEYT